MTEHWSAGPALAVDTETTGVSVHEDRIITAAVVHLQPGQRPRTLTWVIDPETDVPDEAAAVHGWTTEKLREHLHGWKALRTGNGVTVPVSGGHGQAIFEIAGQVALAMSTNTPVIGHNVSFDLSILQAECRRLGVPTLTDRLGSAGLRGVVDTLVLDKHYSRRKGSRRLIDQVSHYKVMLTGAHDASADALAAARLIPRMVAAYPELGKHPLGWLYQKQIEWRAEQQASLAAYFDRAGKPHDGCCPSWPLHGSCCAPVTAGVSS